LSIGLLIKNNETGLADRKRKVLKLKMWLGKTVQYTTGLMFCIVKNGLFAISFEVSSGVTVGSKFGW